MKSLLGRIKAKLDLFPALKEGWTQEKITGHYLAFRETQDGVLYWKLIDGEMTSWKSQVRPDYVYIPWVDVKVGNEVKLNVWVNHRLTESHFFVVDRFDKNGLGFFVVSHNNMEMFAFYNKMPDEVFDNGVRLEWELVKI